MLKKSLLSHTCVAAAVLLGGVFPSTVGAETEPMQGEIVLYAFDYAPRNWAQANGQLLSINQNQVLFSLLGTVYGGNGSSNFMLPDLRGRTPVSSHNSSNPWLIRHGEKAGTTTATLSQMPGVAGTALTTATHGVVTSPRLAGNATVSTVTVAPLPAPGQGWSIATRPPSLGMNYSVSLVGTFGTRDCTMGEIITSASAYVNPNYDNMLPADGQLLSISLYPTLYSILGTTYGGDGINNFALPNLNGRLPVGAGISADGSIEIALGEIGGATQVSVDVSNMPAMVRGHQLPTKALEVGSSPRLADHPVTVVTGSTPVSSVSSVTVPTQPPVLGVHHLICVSGSFPVRS